MGAFAFVQIKQSFIEELVKSSHQLRFFMGQKKIEAFGFETITQNVQAIIKNAKNLNKERFEHHDKRKKFFKEHHHDDEHQHPHLPPFSKKPPKFQLLLYQKSYYVYKDNHLFKSLKSPSYLILYLLGGVLMILLLSYYYIIKSLKPMKKLQQEIRKYGQGHVDIDVKSDKSDEISQIANEFDNAVQKIEKLQNTRKLFLRNVMHELKTPITKGKLIVSLIPDDEYSQMLSRLCLKLELLIEEMANVEKITSSSFVLHKKEYRVIDILENSIDLLFLDEPDIEIDVALTMSCDFNLMSIVFKNLIDNALKYSPTQSLRIKSVQHRLYFINEGEALHGDFTQYLEPFHKGELKEANQKGLGLGLYIVENILKLHGFELGYYYEKGKHHFFIECLEK